MKSLLPQSSAKKSPVGILSPYRYWSAAAGAPRRANVAVRVRGCTGFGLDCNYCCGKVSEEGQDSAEEG